MSKPVIADNKPKKIKLEQGEEYLFCACGQSSDQPFCDGTHAKADTDLTPQSFTAEKTENAFLCQCKHTRNPPYCDGSHKQFDDEQVGQEGHGYQ